MNQTESRSFFRDPWTRGWSVYRDGEKIGTVDKVSLLDERGAIIKLQSGEKVRSENVEVRDESASR